MARKNSRRKRVEPLVRNVASPKTSEPVVQPDSGDRLFRLGIIGLLVGTVGLLAVAAYLIDQPLAWTIAIALGYTMIVSTIHLYFNRDLSFNLTVIGLATAIMAAITALADWISNPIVWVVAIILVLIITAMTFVIIEYNNNPKYQDFGDEPDAD